MALREEFQKSGTQLFKGRSYFPLLIIGVFLIALKHYKLPHDSQVLERAWEFSCLFISFFGLWIRIFTIGHVPGGTSGRTTAEPTASELNTTGIYSLVRHPLYLGNFIIWLGIVLSIRVIWFAVIAVLLYWIYYERIMFAEEEYLRGKFGDAYLKWSETTPAIIPSFKHWKKPHLPFSLKVVLRREYSGFFAIIASFAVLDLLEESIVNHRLAMDPWWIYIFLAGLVIYLALRTIKKKTNFLTVQGR